MAEKLKIISLGGLNEIGKNLTVYEYGGDIIVVDCGMGFPDSYSPTFAVPSARRGLTSLFGMGRGGTPVLSPPYFFRFRDVRRIVALVPPVRMPVWVKKEY